ncbi:MAG TPA: hypothetical protein VKG82_04520 [Solirubrobacteraceae bacterium]|nr:hypothetical protein [Solirubrobacteraceae bacterium]
MAYLMTHFWPGATEEQYATTLATMHPAGGLPEGQSSHVGGVADGGILISAVWESKEHADRFLQEKLIPSMPIEGGFSGQPEQRTADITVLTTA